MQRRNLPTDLTLQDVAAHNPVDPKSPTAARGSTPAPRSSAHRNGSSTRRPPASVVVENNSNGEILAMASYPTVRQPLDGQHRRRQVRSTASAKRSIPTTGKADPDKSVLVNRAVQGRYNLGSTFKPFVAWSAMHSGVIGPNEPYLDTGRVQTRVDPRRRLRKRGALRVQERQQHPHQPSSAYGPVTVADALAVSSDAFFYRLGEKFWEIDEHNASVDPTLKGKSTLKDDLERFGFGKETGVQLPFEWPGRIPDDAVKKQLVDHNVLGKNEVAVACWSATTCRSRSVRV